MTDIKDIWVQVDEAFDADDSIEIDQYLQQQGIKNQQISESVSTSAKDFLDSTFNPELLPKDTKLSKYKILKQINSGGQSEIYLAKRSDGVYEKTVVIKFMAQRYAVETLKQQFLQEMQLLADFNHPGIVQIIDGGITKNDQPWLVLNYIDGLHIDEYSQQNTLSTDDIVQLFLDLSEALNFVHLRGIVHKDIKPSNILINKINSIPYPVILDFGISNKADSQDKYIFGTTGYSAPEQIAGKKLDQRADIYSLGVLLADLLLNDKDTSFGKLNKLQQSKVLNKAGINKDLIQIIQISTQNKPNNRYQNINAFRVDLNNYLHQLPLLSQQNNLGQILLKTYKRHKLICWMSVVLLFSIVGFSLKYTNDLANQQQQTAKAKNNSDELFNFMLTDLFSHLSQIGRVDVLKQVTEKSIQHLQQQDVQSLDDKSHFQTAVAYTNAGKVFDALGSSELALEAYQKGQAALNHLAEKPLYKHSYLSQLALIKNQKSLVLVANGEAEKTERNLLESLKLSEQLVQIDPNIDLEHSYEAHTQLGWFYMEYEKPEKALSHIQAAIKTAKSMNQRQLNYNWMFNLSQAYQVMAWYQFDYGEPDAAITSINSAIELASTTIKESGETIRYVFNQLTLINQLNFFLLENKTVKTADNTITQAIEIGEQLQKQAPKNKDYLRELSYSYSMAAQFSEQNQNYHQALNYYNLSLEISKLMSLSDPKDFSNTNDFANDLIEVGKMHEKLMQLSQAESKWLQAIEIMKPIHILESNNKYYTNTLIYALLKTKQFEQAKPLITQLKESGFKDSDFEQLLEEYHLDL